MTADPDDRIDLPSAPRDVHRAHLLSVALRLADDRHWTCQRAA